MSFRLVIRDDAYALQEGRDGGWTSFAVLERGADALLPLSRAIGEAALEAAIETAEDWLMPHAARLRGAVLEVDDAAGRLKPGLKQVLGVAAGAWSVEDVEGFFLRLLDMTTGRVPSSAVRGNERFVADVLLLRELAHHGQLREIRLM